MPVKTCPTCCTEKTLTEFPRDSSRKLGVAAQCRDCRAAKSKEYRALSADRRKAKQAEWREANRDHLREKNARRRIEKRAMCLIAAARTRSRNKGTYFALDGFAEELQRRIDAGRCEISGVDFDLSPGRKPNSPSLDRINPSLGYTPENVRVICHALNAALGDWGESGLAPIIAGWMLQKNAINAEAAKTFIESTGLV